MCVFQEENAVCIFSGKPYSDLSNEGAESRSREMRRDQEAVERWSSDTRSPRTVARQLPISRAKYEREREREREINDVCVCVCVSASRNALLREINTKQVVVVMGMTGSGKTTQVPQFILENYIGGCGHRVLPWQ